jgi:hypothetical protein
VFEALLDRAKKKYCITHNKKPEEIKDAKFRMNLSEMEIEAWYEVKHAILDRKHDIITYILNTKAKTP